MIIETTINMRHSVFTRIDLASKRLNKPRTYIIRILLAKMMEEDKKLLHIWTPVEYQRGDVSDRWKTFHLTLRQDEYEYCLDLRKIFRMSLSAIVGYATDKFLDDLIILFSKQDDSSITDNYLYRNYIIAYRLIDGVHSWRIYWGYTHTDLFEEQPRPALLNEIVPT
ncbi:MAG: hypothetical protein JXA07_15695 [Spirochaetes bacterium]|nr:hypothetical protein [Spirochaetota bacterium]